MSKTEEILMLALCLISLLKLVTAQQIQNSFNFRVDLFASETGYFKVEGYDGNQPMLEMKRDVTYRFYQTDPSNWFHPLGFAYFPDGAHENVDELENGIGNGDSPVYYINNNTSDLDTYEPEFMTPAKDWLRNSYFVDLKVTDPNVQEIFYFCHVHNKMSGRIYIVESEGDSQNHSPEKGLYPHHEVKKNSFDHQCGTFETGKYGLTGLELFCPKQDFVISEKNDSFVDCMEAIDCKMNFEMSTEEYDNRPIETFMHQMVPHHSNAVNMAKILLKYFQGGLAGYANPEIDSEVQDMMLNIINTQNAQITFMRAWLKENSEYITPEPSIYFDMPFSEEDDFP
eukprot:Awhi_evm1s13035